MSEETLKAAFDKFDKDGSGEISASELVSVLLELKKSEAEARDLAGAILIKCDKNSDMRITLAEFLDGFQ